MCLAPETTRSGCGILRMGNRLVSRFEDAFHGLNPLHSLKTVALLFRARVMEPYVAGERYPVRRLISQLKYVGKGGKDCVQ